MNPFKKAKNKVAKFVATVALLTLAHTGFGQKQDPSKANKSDTTKTSYVKKDAKGVVIEKGNKQTITTYDSKGRLLQTSMDSIATWSSVERSGKRTPIVAPKTPANNSKPVDGLKVLKDQKKEQDKKKTPEQIAAEDAYYKAHKREIDSLTLRNAKRIEQKTAPQPQKPVIQQPTYNVDSLLKLTQGLAKVTEKTNYVYVDSIQKKTVLIEKPKKRDVWRVSVGIGQDAPAQKPRDRNAPATNVVTRSYALDYEPANYLYGQIVSPAFSDHGIGSWTNGFGRVEIGKHRNIVGFYQNKIDGSLYDVELDGKDLRDNAKIGIKFGPHINKDRAISLKIGAEGGAMFQRPADVKIVEFNGVAPYVFEPNERKALEVKSSIFYGIGATAYIDFGKKTPKKEKPLKDSKDLPYTPSDSASTTLPKNVDPKLVDNKVDLTKPIEKKKKKDHGLFMEFQGSIYGTTRPTHIMHNNSNGDALYGSRYTTNISFGIGYRF